MVKEQKPLKDSSHSPLSRALLRAAHRDGLPEGARTRALQALGLGTGLAALGAATSRAAASSLGSATATGGAGATTAKATGLVLLKWAGACAIGAAALGSAGYVVHRSMSPVAPTPRVEETARGTGGPASPVTRPVTATTVSVSPSPGVQAEVKTEPAPNPPLAPISTSRSAILPPSAPIEKGQDGMSPPGEESRPSAIAADLDALNSVRGALAAHDSGRALALLDTFEAKRPESPLREEAAALRIEALGAAGRTAEARTLARAFEARYAASPYLDRVHRAASGATP
jgi:hypothetical protein